MNIDSIERGVVIDHIDAGRGMEIVRLMELDKLNCPIAVIRNARSGKTGRNIVRHPGKITAVTIRPAVTTTATVIPATWLPAS